jgi:hypothetical protein
MAKKEFKPTPIPTPGHVGGETNLVYFYILKQGNPLQDKPFAEAGGFSIPCRTVPATGDYVITGDEYYRVESANFADGLQRQQYGVFATESGAMTLMPVRYLVPEAPPVPKVGKRTPTTT